MKPRLKIVDFVSPFDSHDADEFTVRGAQMLGSSIHDDRYHGAASGANGLFHGQFDDDSDSFAVDPLCDFDVDRFGVRSVVPGDVGSVEASASPKN